MDGVGVGAGSARRSYRASRVPASVRNRIAIGLRDWQAAEKCIRSLASTLERISRHQELDVVSGEGAEGNTKKTRAQGLWVRQEGWQRFFEEDFHSGSHLQKPWAVLRLLPRCLPRVATPPSTSPRNVRATALYQLLESYYEQVKALWEDRFEKRYGFWRGFVDSVVARYLDCGTVEAGFARLRCEACGSERLLTLSCKQRRICPSCDAKRAAAFGAFLKDEILEDVGHSLVTFTIPKMLRGYFLRNRELLSDLARLAYETLQVLMAEAVDDERARPGVVAVPQTFGSLVNPHPHVHCLASRGVWHPNGQWTHVPYFDLKAAEKLWAHEVLRLLQQKGLLSDERIELLASFRNSGFSVDATPTVWPSDEKRGSTLNVVSERIRADEPGNGAKWRFS